MILKWIRQFDDLFGKIDYSINLDELSRDFGYPLLAERDEDGDEDAPSRPGLRVAKAQESASSEISPS